MLTPELKEHLEKEGYKFLKEIDGHGLCGIYKFLFTFGLVLGIDSIGYKGRYCYGSELEAVEALINWTGQGDPPGNWIKYKGAGGERSRE